MPKGKELFDAVKKIATREVKSADIRGTGEVVAINGINVTVRLGNNQTIVCKAPAGFGGREGTMVVMGRNDRTQQYEIYNTLYNRRTNDNLEIARKPDWYIAIPWTNVVDGTTLIEFCVDLLPAEANHFIIEVAPFLNNGATKLQTNFQGYTSTGTQIWTHALAASCFPSSGAEWNFINIKMQNFRALKTLYYIREFISTTTVTINGASIAIGADVLANVRIAPASNNLDENTKYRVLWCE